jgi:pimeloyl-ACP methyl ester carboxylesterase
VNAYIFCRPVPEQLGKLPVLSAGQKLPQQRDENHRFIRVKAAGQALKAVLREIADDPAMIDLTRRLIDSMAPMTERRTGFNNDIEICRHLDDHLPLDRITVPTLILHGENDHDVDFEHARHACDRIPGAEMVVFKQAGHVIPLSPEYERYKTSKQTFLEKHAPAS